MPIDLVLDPLAAPYTGCMDMTVIGRVNMLDDDPTVPGVFGVITDPDETTEGSLEWGVMALANHKPKLRNVARQLRLGQRVSLHGSAYPYKVRHDGPEHAIMMCLRCDQITPLPRAEEDGPTWGRVTVTGQVMPLGLHVATGPRIPGHAVYVSLDLSGQIPCKWWVQCYLEGDDVAERAGMERPSDEFWTHSYAPGTWLTCSGRLGHLATPQTGSLFTVTTQMVERTEAPA
jgi:hypothetical protein